MSFEVTATRKRPQLFESLAGQEFVVSTLKNAIEQGHIAHAYLFAGPRGVGKTTCARLLAKALNCQNGPTSSPCGECDNCRGIAKGSNIDVIEIDGASNTGVNDVRVIKEEVLFPPASSRYKIYIIDEVHMLSQSAFNALLKTIEEPPEYVVFIFATTETQKVPATIRSRCQQFNFQLIPLETVKKLLKEACEETGIQAEDEALFWIAKESTGSMRDAYTLFDQVCSFSNGNITMNQIREKLGLVGTERMNGILSDVVSDRQNDALEKVQNLLAKGISVDQIIKDFTDLFRSLLLIKEGVKNESVIGSQINSFPREILNAYTDEQLEAALEMFLNLYRDIRYSLNPRFELELAVTKLGKLKYAASNITVLQRLEKLKRDLETGAVIPQIKMEQPDEKPSDNPANTTSVQPAETKSDLHTEKQDSPVSGTSATQQETIKQPVEESLEAETTTYTKEFLKDVLPQGVGEVSQSEQGLVLEFGSRFFYQAALKDLDRIRKAIHSVTKDDINIVISFSERLEELRNRQFMQEEENREKGIAEPTPIKVSEEETGTHIVDDIMTLFKGHEEK